MHAHTAWALWLSLALVGFVVWVIRCFRADAKAARRDHAYKIEEE